MHELTFAGTYSDHRGTEVLTWRVHPGPGREPFVLETMIRGVLLRGPAFDRLAPTDDPDLHGHDILTLQQGYLSDCLLTARPRILLMSGPVDARLHLGLGMRRAGVRISVTVGDETITTAEHWTFEPAVAHLMRLLPEASELRACASCALASYPADATALAGMQCHRDGAAADGGDPGSAPFTQWVPEFYLCGQWEPRPIPS